MVKTKGSWDIVLMDFGLAYRPSSLREEPSTEEQQAALVAAREAEERRRLDLEEQQRREFEQRQIEQAERERLAQEQLLQQQQMMHYNQAATQMHELERELLGMRGQYERDQMMLEQYDRVRLLPMFVRTILIQGP